MEYRPNTHYFVIAGLFFVDLCILFVIDYGLVRVNRAREKEAELDNDKMQELIARKARPISLNFD